MPYKDPIREKARKEKWYQTHKKECLLRCKKRRIKNQKFLARYKRCGIKCKDCGDSRWQVLEFDHRNPKDKRKNIAALARNGSSLATLKKEIRKCDVVCANCHRMRHNGCVWTENSCALEVHIVEQTVVNREVVSASLM